MTSPFPLDWDYTQLADSYERRAEYHAELVSHTLQSMQLDPGALAVEVGAGTGKLTRLLCDHDLNVLATEPNPRMREVALSQESVRRARWIAGRGEALPLRAGSAALVAYGSSFNVLPARAALDECARVLKAGGYWLALWNHRDLDDPLQREVEAIILRHLPDYDYGRRRESPAADVAAHAAFRGITATERRFVVAISAEDWMQAWHSHATLARQAGTQLPRILGALRSLLAGAETLHVPYFTRVWTAQRGVV
jgi:ubiquinone/menaquinone biosynthesis C-methylase UbiE